MKNLDFIDELVLIFILCKLIDQYSEIKKLKKEIEALKTHSQKNDKDGH